MVFLGWGWYPYWHWNNGEVQHRYPIQRMLRDACVHIKVLINLCNLHGSLIVNMNSSTSMFSWVMFASWNHNFCSFKIQILVSLITLQRTTFELVSLLAMIFLCWNQMMMFMKRLSNLFWRRLDHRLKLDWLLGCPHIH